MVTIWKIEVATATLIRATSKNYFFTGSACTSEPLRSHQGLRAPEAHGKKAWLWFCQSVTQLESHSRRLRQHQRQSQPFSSLAFFRDFLNSSYLRIKCPARLPVSAFCRVRSQGTQEMHLFTVMSACRNWFFFAHLLKFSCLSIRL